MDEVKNPLPTLFTIRLTDEEARFINQNLHLIRGENDNMPRNKIFVTALEKAISNSQPQEIVRDNPELLEQIEQLKQVNESLAQQNQGLIDKINELMDVQENAIVLNLRPEFKEYFWGILEICKVKKIASTYEQLLELMLYAFHKRGEFILDQNDIEYLKQLKQQSHE